MERGELKSYVTRILRVQGAPLVTEVQMYCRSRSVSDRIESYTVVLEKLLRRNFGVYSHAGYGYYHVFNGRYYEPVSMDVIWYGINVWLRECGVPSCDRTSGKYVAYLRDYAAGVIKDRQLRPRLSLMCFRNCVVDFRRPGRRYKHSAEFDVVKMYDFDFDPMSYTKCHIWKAFLGEPDLMMVNTEGVLPEIHKRRVLQMFLGSCLADRESISFEYFLILQGTGANGKSVIYRVLKDMFGDDEIINIKMSQFGRGGDESLRAAFSLKGKRLMYCTESTQGDFKDMSTIKAISSGEPIACREIGGNISTLQRPPVLLCNSNYRWKASDFLNRADPADDSMARRAVLLNFEKTIPVDKRDTMLAERLRKEHSGIFSWIVKGFMELRKNKYRLPQDIMGQIDKKLEKNRSIVDLGGGIKVAGSVVEYTRLKGADTMFREDHPYKAQVSSGELYDNYLAYCKASGVDPVTIQKFGRDMGALGYMKMQRMQNTSGRQFYELWMESEHDAKRFLDMVPSITDDAREMVWTGEEYTDEEYGREMKDTSYHQIEEEKEMEDLYDADEDYGSL